MGQFRYTKTEAKRACLAITRKAVKMYNSGFLSLNDFVDIDKRMQKTIKKMK